MIRAQQNCIAEPPERLRASIAVIGSGPGGAISACLLAEAGLDVVLIEEGPFLPLQSCPAFSREEMVQKYRNGGVTVAMGRTKVAYVEGRCVGGGSEINSGLYHRTPDDILDQWRGEYQVDALSAEELLPHFEANERDLCVSTLPGRAPEASLRLDEGARRLGWKSLEVPRWFRYDTPAGPQAGPSGTRMSMTETFVPRALAAGASLLPDCRARRLVRRGKLWHVEAEHTIAGRRRAVTIEADTVFVAGGAIQTPALLRRSGITRNVGNTLHMHPTIKVVARFPFEVNASGMGVPVHQVKEFSPRISLGCSISAPSYLAMGMIDHTEQLRSVGRDWRQMAVYYGMVRGGCGQVRPLPLYRDALVRYRLDREGRADLADTLVQLCRCLLSAGATALYPTLAGDPPVITSERDLKQLPSLLPHGGANLMTIHLFSTCPMGENPRRAAVDSFGQVHGHAGLYVADGSLLCGAPGVNPQGTIMALARRNAMRFLGRL